MFLDDGVPGSNTYGSEFLESQSNGFPRLCHRMETLLATLLMGNNTLRKAFSHQYPETMLWVGKKCTSPLFLLLPTSPCMERVFCTWISREVYSRIIFGVSQGQDIDLVTKEYVWICIFKKGGGVLKDFRWKHGHFHMWCYNQNLLWLWIAIHSLRSEGNSTSSYFLWLNLF